MVWLTIQAMRLIRLWQRRCHHSPENVSADILEGDVPRLAVQYCNRCGAVRQVWDNGVSTWRLLIPDHLVARNVGGGA